MDITFQDIINKKKRLQSVPMRYGQSEYSWLRSSSHPIANEILGQYDRWLKGFLNLCGDSYDLSRLKRRLKDKTPYSRSFQSVIFELLISHYLSRSLISNKLIELDFRPNPNSARDFDFAIKKRGGKTILIECLSIDYVALYPYRIKGVSTRGIVEEFIDLVDQLENIPGFFTMTPLWYEPVNINVVEFDCIKNIELTARNNSEKIYVRFKNIFFKLEFSYRKGRENTFRNIWLRSDFAWGTEEIDWVINRLAKKIIDKYHSKKEALVDNTTFIICLEYWAGPLSERFLVNFSNLILKESNQMLDGVLFWNKRVDDHRPLAFLRQSDKILNTIFNPRYSPME